MKKITKKSINKPVKIKGAVCDYSKKGERVEISPACDLWMRGAKYGVIRNVKQGIVTIKMDHPSVNKLVKLPLDYVQLMSSRRYMNED